MAALKVEMLPLDDATPLVTVHLSFIHVPDAFSKYLRLRLRLFTLSRTQRRNERDASVIK